MRQISRIQKRETILKLTTKMFPNYLRVQLEALTRSDKYMTRDKAPNFSVFRLPPMFSVSPVSSSKRL